MSNANEERWLAGLERKGNINLLVLLEGMDTHDADAGVPGIVSEPPHPPRDFVEAWLENEGATRGNSRVSLLRIIAIAIAAAGVAGAVITAWPRN